MNSIKLGLFAIIACFFSCVPSVFSAGIFTEIPGLSASAQSSLVAHYDGRSGVSTSNATSSVDSWTPVDGNGNSLPSMVVSSTARGTGAASLITYDGVGNLSFDDTAPSSQGRYLLGALTNDQSTSFTVMWRGHYKADAPFQTSGTYAYNIGINDISHQRDDGGGGFRVELYNGTTYAGDDITAYDGISTVWSTVLTANSHNVFANGTNLNGERVTQASLHDDDVIVAGQTRFSVRVEGGVERESEIERGDEPLRTPLMPPSWLEG